MMLTDGIKLGRCCSVHDKVKSQKLKGKNTSKFFTLLFTFGFLLLPFL